MISYRQATDADLPQLYKLIELGFARHFDKIDPQFGHEHYILYSYLYQKTNNSLEQISVAEVDGIIAAAVGVIPQSLCFDGKYIPIGAISPVVSHPDYSGRHLAAECLKYAEERLRSQGITMTFLWGLPRYYPKYGYVPLLPRYKTRLSLEQATLENHDVHGHWRDFDENDAEALQKLYASREQELWLQPQRNVEWWRNLLLGWQETDPINTEVPFTKRENLRLWENDKGKLCGYLVFNSIDEKIDRKYVNEGAAIDEATALEMIVALREEIEPEKILHINGTPKHFLNRAAYQLGGIHLNPPPLAGMLKVIDWDVFFEQQKSLWQRRLSECSARLDIRLLCGAATFCLKAEFGEIDVALCGGSSTEQTELKHLLTRIIFGIATDKEKSLITGSGLECLEQLFPKQYPFIWDVNYLY